MHYSDCCFLAWKLYSENYDVLKGNYCFKQKKTHLNGNQVTPRLCWSNFRQNQVAEPSWTTKVVVPLHMFQMLVPLAMPSTCQVHVQSCLHYSSSQTISIISYTERYWNLQLSYQNIQLCYQTRKVEPESSMLAAVQSSEPSEQDKSKLKTFLLFLNYQRFEGVEALEGCE